MTPRVNPGSASVPEKHPSIAMDPEGRLLLAWVRVPSWGSRGTLHWRVFAADGGSVLAEGEKRELAPWSKGAAVYRPGEGFRVFY